MHFFYTNKLFKLLIAACVNLLLNVFCDKVFINNLYDLEWISTSYSNVYKL